MIVDTMENGIFKSVDGDKILLTITSLGDNVYRATNSIVDVTAEVIVLDDCNTKVKCIEHKVADKNGRFRKSTKLLSHNLKWLDYMLEEAGFIRKKKCINE
jgi:hypothetical protein